jgi:hypothetical protein
MMKRSHISSYLSLYFSIFLLCTHLIYFLGNFFGFVPSDQAGQFLMRIAMMSLASSQLLARSLGCALIAAAVGKSYVGLLIVGELTLFFIYLLARRDFYYWIPVDGFTRIILSLVIRIVVKTVADFTGLLHLRYVGEREEREGGYELLSFIMAI